MPKLTHTIRTLVAAALPCAAVLLALTLPDSRAAAAAIEFAEFNLISASQPLTFTNYGNDLDESGTLQALNVPVIFNFTAQSGLDTSDRAATMTINAPGTRTYLHAKILDGGLIEQPISDANTLSIIENGTNKNLLSLSFTGDLVGPLGGSSANLRGAEANGDLVSFSSDFGSFGASDKSFSLGLAAITSPLAFGDGKFLKSFVANINGNFSSDFTSNVPEPASVAMFGIGLLAVAATARRKAVSRGFSRGRRFLPERDAGQKRLSFPLFRALFRPH